MIATFLSALGVGFSGAMMPGSLLTCTIRQALAIGIRAGFVLVAGHLALEAVLIGLIFLGFDSILQSMVAQIAIGLAGGALLLYMGVDMVVGAVRGRVQVAVEGTGGSTAGNATDRPARGLFLSGLALSAANPYFLLWWAIIGLGFLLDAYRLHGAAGVGVYFAGHAAADVIWYGFISLLVGSTRRFLSERPYRAILTILGLLLIYFGARFVLGAVSTWTGWSIGAH